MQTVVVKTFDDSYAFDSPDSEAIKSTTYKHVISFQFGGQYLQMLFENGCSKVIKDVVEADITPEGVSPVEEEARNASAPT